MNIFPSLTDDEVEAIVRYIRNETDPDYKTKLYGAEGSSNPEHCLIPCKDTIFYDDEVTSSQALNIMELSDNGTKPMRLEEALRMGFTYKPISDGYYRYEIKTLGWFNIDAEVKGLPGTTSCNLLVKANNPEPRAQMIVYVFFPERKDLTVGVFHTDDALYHFEKYEGKIPLFLGAKGVVLAFGNYREQFYYGVQSFISQESQTIQVNVHKSTEAELIKAIEDAAIEGIDLNIVKRKMKIIYRPCNSDSARDSAR
jgi:hypothetical protein